jgi:ankyrin repeat protein
MFKHGVQIDNDTYVGILWASQRGMTKIVKHLIAYGVRVDSRNHSKHHSPMITAIQSGNIQLLKILLKSGMDPNSFGGGLFMLARMEGDIKMVDLLNKYQTVHI